MTLQLLDIVLHLDKYLQAFVSEYSILTYFLLFLIIFFETGLVVAPFLPGDSLLFVAGTLAAVGSFKIEILFIIIFIAAVLGDALNYHIGKFVGPRVFRKESSLLFNRGYLVRAQKFYEKHGRKTIVLARFIPVIRTFAPFVAGIGKMPYRIFLVYNVLGALLWCILFLIGGFLFGNIPFVKENLSLLIILVIILSIIPFLIEIIKNLLSKNLNKK